jgi:hypothetical protein
MASKLFKSLVSMFGRKGSRACEADMLTYAKTEYANDWEYAFHYMLKNKGQGPRMGVYQ